MSLRTTLETYERQTGRTPDELHSVACPVGYAYLWDWFHRLAFTRPVGMTIGAITETEMRSFFLNRRIVPASRELLLLARVDVLMMESIATKGP